MIYAAILLYLAAGVYLHFHFTTDEEKALRPAVKVALLMVFAFFWPLWVGTALAWTACAKMRRPPKRPIPIRETRAKDSRDESDQGAKQELGL